MHSFFLRKPKQQAATYNAAEKTPVIRCSICTGEKVAGFRRKADGSFEEVMLIRDESEIRQFRALYGKNFKDLYNEWKQENLKKCAEMNLNLDDIE